MNSLNQMLHSALSNTVPPISLAQNMSPQNPMQRVHMPQRPMNMRPLVRMPNNGMTSPQQVSIFNERKSNRMNNRNEIKFENMTRVVRKILGLIKKKKTRFLSIFALFNVVALQCNTFRLFNFFLILSV